MYEDAVADRERDAALAQVLSADSLVLDIGANRGQFARELLAVVPCNVHCFEPGAEAFADLELWARDNPLVTAVPLGVAEKTGSVEFFVSQGDKGSSLLQPVPGQSSQWATLSHSRVVDVTRIDDYLISQGIDFVGLLKTDCQGADGQVLKSAGRFLNPDQIGALLVELNFHAFYQEQDTTSSVIQLAEDSGYFLAGFFRHFNRAGWLWWADALFLPNRPPFSTQ